MKKAVKVIGVTLVVALLVAVLVACIPTDPDKAVKNLEKEGYLVTSSQLVSAPIKALVKGVEDVVVATDGEEGITLVYFESAGAAKDAMEDLKKYFDDDDLAVKRSGKVVYAGTDAAIKAVK